MNYTDISSYSDPKKSTSKEGVLQAVDMLKRLGFTEDSLLEGKEPSQQELVEALDKVNQQIAEIKRKIAGKKRPSIPRRSFLDGMASVLDISGRYSRSLDYRYPIADDELTSFKSDADAIRSDWEKIGLDIDNAIRKHGEKLS
jgi:hypothetical protein